MCIYARGILVIDIFVVFVIVVVVFVAALVVFVVVFVVAFVIVFVVFGHANYTFTFNYNVSK